ncbi:histone-like nucleoid-structuring protein, MvaT/MvaU family [Pseudomonas laurentiana]
MSRLAEFRILEQKLAQQLAELEQLKGSSALKQEVEFEEKLRALLNTYGFSLRDIINILDPQSSRGAVPAVVEKAPRRARKTKQYKNPHNNEVIETRGGNHRLLKEWKAQYGAEEVESWVS